jgi:hypothetical protein
VRASNHQRSPLERDNEELRNKIHKRFSAPACESICSASSACEVSQCPLSIVSLRFSDRDASISVAQVNRSSSALDGTSKLNTENIHSLRSISVAKESGMSPTLEGSSALNIRDIVVLKLHLSGKQTGIVFCR